MLLPTCYLLAAAAAAATDPPAPDIAVGAIGDIARFGTAELNGEGWTAYAWGSTICNVGTDGLAFLASPSNQHPVTVENLYRLRDGRFEQIGMSWVLHGFCALQQSVCATCRPTSGGCPATLGIGCSSPTSASSQGSQSLTGPRSIVNPATVLFPGAWSDPVTTDPSVLRERLRVRLSDLDPALNQGSLYFAELHLLHPEDAAAGAEGPAAANNVAYRPVAVGPWTTSGYQLLWSGAMVANQSALHAWQAADSKVRVVDGVVEGDGRFTIAASVTALPTRQYRYDYTLFNETCARAFAGLAIAGAVQASALTFHALPHHSGEPYSSEPWTATSDAAGVRWYCAGSFAQNPTANALRWSTAYSFSLLSMRAPSEGTVTLTLFTPDVSGPATVAVTLPVPAAPPCALADLDCDGVVSSSDLTVLLSQWGVAGSADLDASGQVDGADIAIMLARWSA